MNKEDIQKIIKDAINKTKIKLSCDIVVQTPKDSRWGDYSTNVAMELGKILKKNPMKIAEKIVGNINNKYIYVEVVAPGFINIKFDQSLYIKKVQEIIKEKDNYGKSDIGKGKTVVIDYSSPNIAKPMSVGHLRSTIIGASVVNILRFQGYKAIGDNHIGDWGTQFGKLLYAYKKWGKDIKNIDINDMLNLYVRFHKEAEIDPTIEEYARKEFKKLEDNDKENRDIWKKFREVSLVEFDKIYKTLGVYFEETHGESFYESMLNNIIDEAVKKKIAKKSLGALIIDVGKDLPPLLIQKKDGATLYATRDLATISYREKVYKPSILLYAIGNEQKIYLKQLFIAAKKMKLSNAQFVHIGFGLMRMKEGKMSTRAGRIVYLEDVIKKAIDKSYKIVDAKNHKLSEKIKKEISYKVGIGAIKYNDLSQNRNTDMLFDYDKMLSLEGNSAPYLMYTYARAKSILRKVKNNETTRYKMDDISLNDSEEKLLKTLGKFDEAVKISADKYQPNFLCEYLFHLANDFNYFYQENPVLKASDSEKNMRLSIVLATTIIIKNGLKLLGIDVLDKM